MSKKHKVKSHHWKHGVLHTVEHFFDTLDEALAHSAESTAHTVKVYSPDGELEHIKTEAVGDTYA